MVAGPGSNWNAKGEVLLAKQGIEILAWGGRSLFVDQSFGDGSDR